MIERRDGHPVGVASLNRLLELTRIPEQYDALGSLRYSQNVRERQLGGFVDEQDVYAAMRIYSRPKERGPSSDRACRAKKIQSLLVVFNQLQRGNTTDFLLGNLVDAFEAQSRGACSRNDLRQEVADNLVTVCGYADPPSLANQAKDHTCSRICLSGSRRTLNRNDTLIQGDADALGSGQNRLPRL